MNNRGMLAVYTLLLWVSLGLMVVPRYVTYERRNSNLNGKATVRFLPPYPFPSFPSFVSFTRSFGCFTPS
ncbi:hypothetical protein C8R45DRAFT_970843, partial [Mycena sanguinolenta]